MLLTKSNNITSGTRKRTLNRQVKMGPLSIQFVTILTLALLALFYLVQSTESATKNYKIRELDEKKKALELENERIEIESARLKSLNEMKDKIKDMGLESSGQINYLPSQEPFVKK